MCLSSSVAILVFPDASVLGARRVRSEITSHQRARSARFAHNADEYEFDQHLIEMELDSTYDDHPEITAAEELYECHFRVVTLGTGVTSHRFAREHAALATLSCYTLLYDAGAELYELVLPFPLPPRRPVPPPTRTL